MSNAREGTGSERDCLIANMADPTWSKLAWTVRKSTRIKTFYEDIAEW